MPWSREPPGPRGWGWGWTAPAAWGMRGDRGAGVYGMGSGPESVTFLARRGPGTHGVRPRWAQTPPAPGRDDCLRNGHGAYLGPSEAALEL